LSGTEERSAPGAKDGSGGVKPPIVILNQYYVPDVASTGYLVHELALELVRLGYDVESISTMPSYGPPESWVDCPHNEILDGVRVHRLRSTRMSKNSLIGRGLNYLSFLAPLGLRMLFGSSHKKVYLYSSAPPFMGIIGAVVSLVRRHRYIVLLYDAYPQLAVWSGTFKGGGFIEWAWHKVNRLAYRRARQTIVLCHKAKALVVDNYGVDPATVHVIANWADGELLRPKPKSESEFAQSTGLVEPFTLMYSGNMGLCYEYETLLKAAALLKDDPFRLVWVGGGGRRDWLEQEINERGLTNTTIHPYQPFDRLRDSLSGCDASLVTIAQDVEGMSFPSKLYTSLAMGKSIVAVSENQSELRDIVESNDVGVWAELGDAQGLADAIRGLIEDPDRCARQGVNARALFEAEYTRAISAGKYADVFELAAKR